MGEIILKVGKSTHNSTQTLCQIHFYSDHFILFLLMYIFKTCKITLSLRGVSTENSAYDKH